MKTFKYLLIFATIGWFFACFVSDSFAGNASVPVGSYKNFKLVLSETMKVSGSDAGAHYTTSTGTLTIVGTDGTAASTATWPAAPPISVASLTENTETHTATASQQGESTFTLDLNANDGNNYIEIYCSTGIPADPIVVKADSTMSMWFDFDTQGTVHYVNDGGNDKMYYTPPGSGTAFYITVDGRTHTITEANMRIDF